MKELPIGTEIKLPFTTLKVEVDDKDIIASCSKCFLLEICEENSKFVYETFGACIAYEREDKTYVIFKEISHE